MQLRQFVVALAVLALVASGCTSAETKKKELLEAGKRLAAEKRHVEAILQFRNALQVDDKYADARVQLAEAYIASGNPESAYREYQRAADLLPDDARVQKRAATLLFMAGQFDDVRSRTQAVLKKNPKDLEAQLLYANALVGLNDLEEGIKQIEEAIQLDPDHSATYVNLALLKMAGGQREAAIAAFTKAVELDPRSLRARLALTYFHLAAGDVGRAEASLNESLKLEPRDPMANRTLAAVYLGTGREPLAEAPLKLVADVTKTPRARYALSDYYARLKRFGDAREVLEPMGADDKTFADAHTRLARIRYQEGDAAGAKKVLATVLSRFPGHPDALQLRARWMLIDGQPNQALERATAAVNAAPRNVAAIYLRGVIQVLNGLPGEAAKSFNDVLRLNPRAAAAQVQLSQLNLRQGNVEQAVGFAQEAVASSPASPQGRLVFARALLAQGDLPRAEVEIQRLSKAFPKSPSTNAARGTLELLKGNQAAARVAFQAAFDADPASIAALTGLTTLDVQQRKLPDARVRVEQRLALEPKRYDVLLLAAKVFVQEDNLARAEQVLQQAIVLAPTTPEPFVMLGELYRKQNRLDQARAEFDEIAKREPDNLAARTMAALLVHARGDIAAAKRRYLEVLALQSRAVVAANNLAWIYADERENLDLALELAERVTDLIPDYAEGWDTLGWVYHRKQLPFLAIAPFEKAIAKDPRNATFHLHLGMARAGSGDAVRGRESFQTALKLQPNFPDAQREMKALTQ